MRKITVFLTITLITITLASFAYGWISHRYKIFPYPQIKYLHTTFLEDNVSERLHAELATTNTQFSSGKTNLNVGTDLSNLISEQRVIESLTLPILSTSFDLSSIETFGASSKSGGPKGGLCAIENQLVVFDGAGNGILINLDSMIIEAYILSTSFVSEVRHELNRINDVACQATQTGNVAYISYEMVDTKSSDLELRYLTAVGKIELKDFQKSHIHQVWSSELTGSNEAGRLSFLDGDNFLITFADYSTPEQQRNTRYLAQDETTLSGKVVLVNLPTNKHKIYSKGHRNSQGLFITKKGHILTTEHGPRGGDELNEITMGGNYGWPRETHGVDYDSYKWWHGEIGRHDNYNQPIFSWVPSIGISNLLEVQNFHFSWFGDILISSLKSGSLFRTRRDKGVGVEFVEQIWLGPRLRDIEEIQDSRIALWTDTSNLIILSVAEKFISKDERTENVSWTDASLKPCLNCHHFGLTNKTHAAPSLTRIFSRNIASDDFKYSKGLSSIKGKWTKESLKQYIMDPGLFAEGSTMSFRIKDEKLADEIVDQLKQLDNIGE